MSRRARTRARVGASLACVLLCALAQGVGASATAANAPAAPSVPTAALNAADPAAALRAYYLVLQRRLEQSAFQQHLYIESIEGARASQGDVYAVVDYPIGTVREAFSSPVHWCDALILHLNVKYCHPAARNARPVLLVAIGTKRDQPLASAFRVEFAYAVTASLPEYLEVSLEAPHGPLGTGNYRIGFEAVRLDEAHSFVHLRYSYSYGLEARLAMRTYLMTTGRGKVGFTPMRDPDDPQQAYVSGVRGAIERNTMRYYLAIDAYLGAFSAPPAERVEQSLQRWFSATERYARQLHEIDREEYLAMKRSEYRRQQTMQ